MVDESALAASALAAKREENLKKKDEARAAKVADIKGQKAIKAQERVRQFSYWPWVAWTPAGNGSPDEPHLCLCRIRGMLGSG